MHKLANLSAAERRRMITDFIDDTFAGIDVSPDFLTMMRGAMPDLPEEPTREQIEAWVELAELVQDPGFRARLRQTATTFAGPMASHEIVATSAESIPPDRPRITEENPFLVT